MVPKVLQNHKCRPEITKRHSEEWRSAIPRNHWPPEKIPARRSWPSWLIYSSRLGSPVWVRSLAVALAGPLFSLGWPESLPSASTSLAPF